MPFNCIHYLCIYPHPNIIGEHLINCPFRPCNFLLIFDVVNNPIIEGLNIDIPHVIMTYCRIHPFFDQSS